MTSIEKIRIIFKRLSEIESELKSLNYDSYKIFKGQNQDLSDLEHYNLRKIIRDESFEPIDTLEMRKSLIEKWEIELVKLKTENGGFKKNNKMRNLLVLGSALLMLSCSSSEKMSRKEMKVSHYEMRNFF